MSMKKHALLMGLMLAGISENITYMDDGPISRYDPNKVKPTNKAVQNPGIKKWLVNAVIVHAVTRNAAIKKAKKHPDWNPDRTEITAEVI